MKIAFAVAVAVGILTGRSAGLDGSVQHLADVAGIDDPGAPEVDEAATGRGAEEVLEEGGGGGLRGPSRSLQCGAPKFGNITLPYIDRSGGAPRTMGFGPIGADQKLMPSNFIGNPRVFFTYATTPFYVCNRQLQSLLPGLAGYTVRAFVNLAGCDPATLSVRLRLVDAVTNKLVHRQTELSPPYMLFGNKVPFASVADIEYGSELLPDGAYEVSATLFSSGVVADKTSLGTQIVVVSC